MLRHMEQPCSSGSLCYNRGSVGGLRQFEDHAGERTAQQRHTKPPSSSMDAPNPPRPQLLIVHSGGTEPGNPCSSLPELTEAAVAAPDPFPAPDTLGSLHFHVSLLGSGSPSALSRFPRCNHSWGLPRGPAQLRPPLPPICC